MGLIGGADVHDCTRRTLKRVISNALAKSINWRGVHGKTLMARGLLHETRGLLHKSRIKISRITEKAPLDLV